MSLLAGLMGGLQGLGKGMEEVGDFALKEKAQRERDERQNQFQTDRDNRQNQFQLDRDDLANERALALEEMRKKNNLAVEGVRHNNALKENTHADGLKRQTGFNPDTQQWEEYTVDADGKPKFLGARVGAPASEVKTPGKPYLSAIDEAELNILGEQLKELRKVDTTTMSEDAIKRHNDQIEFLEGQRTEIVNRNRGKPSPSSIIGGQGGNKKWDNYVMQSGQAPGLLNNPKQNTEIDPDIMVKRGADGNPDRPYTRQAMDWVEKVFDNNAEFWGPTAQAFKDAARDAMLDIQRITNSLPREVQVELGNVRRLMEQGAPVSADQINALRGKVDKVTLNKIERYTQEQAKAQ